MIPKLLYGAATLGLCYLANYCLIIRSQTNSATQFLVVAALGLHLGLGVWWLLQRARLAGAAIDRVDGSFVVALGLGFSLTWGRQIFMSFFFHDEIGYFAVVNQNWWNTGAWLLDPLNEHFQPLLKLSLVFLCQIWGINNYFGIALTTFVVAVALIVTLYAFLRQTSRSPVVAFVATALFATAFNFADVYQYKAAGYPLLVSMLFLLLTILQLIAPQDPRAAATRPVRPLVLFSITLCLTVFFSSLITLPIIFLAPFLAIAWRGAEAAGEGRQTRRQLSIWSAVALLPTALFYYCRWRLGIAPPQHLGAIEPAALLDMVGSFAGQPLGMPAAANTAVGIMIVGLLVMTAPLILLWDWVQLKLPERWRGGPPMFLALLGFGLLISTIAVVQVFAGRGFQRAGQGFHRYEIFPILGALCAAVAVFSVLPNFFRRPLPLRFSASLGLAFVVLAVMSHYRMDRLAPWPLKFCREVNRQRGEFFSHLERVVHEARYRNFVDHGYGHQTEFTTLPNLRLEQSPPALEADYQLQHYARALSSPRYDTLFVPFAPLGREHHALLTDRVKWPETAAFYARYFPQQTAALTADGAVGFR
jgi:hypothetical protein